jgi:murein DD-endopeptidase MepM/ murein hydrolase activator NlpD
VSAGTAATAVLLLVAGLPATSGPAATPTADAPAYAFPVRPATAADYGRAHHDYPATDVFAPCGSPVVAPTAGTLTEVRRRDAWDPRTDRGAARGGRSVTLVGDDGVRYYGSHLASVRRGLAPGDWVAAGEPLGRVGSSGSARGVACHLHFGISPACGVRGDWWTRRGALPPYPYLRAWERGVDRSPAPAVRRLAADGGCPRAPGR